MPSNNFQQELRNYDPESHSQWFLRLPKEDQIRYNSLIYSLMTNKYIPPTYRGAAKRFNKTFRANADYLPLTDEQIYEIDSYIVRTYYDVNVLAGILAPCMSGQLNTRWQTKVYEQAGDDFPGYTIGPEQAFRNLPALDIGVDVKGMWQGFGWGINWNLEFTLVDVGNAGIYNPATWHSSRAAVAMAKCEVESLLHGSAGEHSPNDVGITGLFNMSGITAVTNADGTNNDLTDAATDVEAFIEEFKENMVDQYEPGKNILLTTSGPATETIMQESTTTDRTMYERIQKKYFDSGIINEWWVVNELDTGSGFPSATEGQALLMRVHPTVIDIEVIYPLQKKPNIGMKEYADDIAYTLLKAVIIKCHNKSCLIKNNTAITTTSKGLVNNGLFMVGSSASPHQRPLNPTELAAMI